MPNVREAKGEDLDAVLAIERESFPNPWPAEEFQKHQEGGIFLVYELRGKVLGYLIASEKTSPFRGSFFHLENIAVARNARRQGIATALLADLISIAKEKGILTLLLEVREENLAALTLYKKFGFIEKMSLLGFYSDGDNARLMELQLATEPTGSS